MSVGVNIYYKLESNDGVNVKYIYSGHGHSGEYDEESVLSYDDGAIIISLMALDEKTITEILKTNDIVITKP